VIYEFSSVRSLIRRVFHHQFQELLMKMIIAAVPCTLLALNLFGCTQHSTAATVASPQPAAASVAPVSGDTNTFGESREAAAGSAAAARDASMASDSAKASSTSR
jgi:hypothetical protein